jgi:hypothetical protein
VIRWGCSWCDFSVEEPAPELTHASERGGIQIRLTQRTWQPLMYAHVADEHPERYAELPDLDAVLAEQRDTLNRMLASAVSSIRSPR